MGYQTTPRQTSQTDELLESAASSLMNFNEKSQKFHECLNSIRLLIGHTTSPLANVLPVMLVLFKNYGIRAKYFPNTNTSNSTNSPQPVLHRYRNFKRDVRIPTEQIEARLKELNGDNIMTVVSRMAHTMTMDELTQLANDGVRFESKMSDKNDSKRAKMSQPDDPVVVSEEDIALLNELNMLELLGRAKSFQFMFPQYNVYFINYNFSMSDDEDDDNNWLDIQDDEAYADLIGDVELEPGTEDDETSDDEEESSAD